MDEYLRSQGSGHVTRSDFVVADQKSPDILDSAAWCPVLTTESLTVNPIRQHPLIVVNENRLIETLHTIREGIELSIEL